jgi:hypothetical protein
MKILNHPKNLQCRIKKKIVQMMRRLYWATRGFLVLAASLIYSAVAFHASDASLTTSHNSGQVSHDADNGWWIFLFTIEVAPPCGKA